MSERLFPIMGLSYRADEDIRKLRSEGCTTVIIAVPWSLLAPHEEQARLNHGGQTLRRLAERGGLGPDEAMAVIEDRRYRQMGQGEANQKLIAAVKRFRATQPPEPQPDAHPHREKSQDRGGDDGR